MTNNPTQVESEGLAERLTRAEVNAREARQLGDGDAIGLAITTLSALRTANDELVEAAWRPIETAPYSETVEVRAGSMTFLASLHKDGSLNSDEMPCDQWVADVEGEHPPCWTDGACWESNSNEMTSLQPVAWRPVNCAALRSTDETARLRERVLVLEEALEPFAEMAKWLDDTNARRDAIYCGGVPGLRCEITQNDYHRALAAPSSTEQGEG